MAALFPPFTGNYMRTFPSLVFLLLIPFSNLILDLESMEAIFLEIHRREVERDRVQDLLKMKSFLVR